MDSWTTMTVLNQRMELTNMIYFISVRASQILENSAPHLEVSDNSTWINLHDSRDWKPCPSYEYSSHVDGLEYPCQNLGVEFISARISERLPKSKAGRETNERSKAKPVIEHNWHGWLP